MGSKPIGISASRSSTIMGLNPWQSELEVWQKIMEEREPGFNAANNYELPVFEETAAIRWGNAFEDAVCKLAEEKNGLISDREKLFKYNKHTTCHIDGQYFELKEGVLHEGKTTSIFYFNDNFGEPGTAKVPAQYQAQCQHQMLCTGAEKVILSVLVFPRRVDDWEDMGWETIQEPMNWYLCNKNDKENPIFPLEWARTLNEMGYFHQYEIPANKETQKMMLEYYENWWEDHIIARRPPEPKYYADIKRIWRAPVGTIIATNQLERWCKEYKDIGVELGVKGPLTKRREQLKMLLLKSMMKLDGDVDEDSRDKTVLRSKTGDKLLSYSGKVFR